MYNCFYMSIALAILLSHAVSIDAQTYSDYFGNGHQVGMTTSSSNDNGNDKVDDAFVGTGFFPDEKGASRFLAQATMGANYEAIQNVVSIGIDEWIDNQFSLVPTSFQSEYDRIFNEAIAIVVNNPIHKDEYMSYTFYEMLLKHPDALRQKVAFALSQIFVISPPNSIVNARTSSNFYDKLYYGAFGNFHDILLDVSIHGGMGLYLSHFRNRKADVVQGTFPDENYAREIMQLFSIGLYELNLDGSHKKDANGESIPTYDIKDIQELARVFTGLAGSVRLDGDTPGFHASYTSYDFREPMGMYYDFHDKREKILVDDTVLPANQMGMKDIEDAVFNLYNHPNVGPFISIRLIQHLVKSNPSSQYIFRVAKVFNDDGNGVRGNMQEVVRAILTDPEARDCSWMTDPSSGKLIQPVQRLTNLFLAFDLNTPSNKIWFKDEGDILAKFEQSFLASPTVFNFFSPFYAEEYYVAPNGLVSPEFQILNSTSGMYYLNEIENSLKVRPFKNRTKLTSNGLALELNHSDEPVLDFSDEIAVYNSQGLSALIDRLDLLLSRGQLESGVKNIIMNTLNNNIQNDSNYDVDDIIKDALYFIMITPNYTILK